MSADFLSNECCFPEELADAAEWLASHGVQADADEGSVAEIAVFADEDDIYYVRKASEFSAASLSDMRRTLAELGAPCDLYSMAELDSCDLHRYRLILLPNADEISSARMEKLRALQVAGASVLWMYAPNYAKEGVRDVAHISETVGMTVVESKNCQGCFVYDGWMFDHDASPPYFAIEDENTIPFAWFEDVTVAMAATKDYRSIYVAMPFIPSAALREVVHRLGIFLYSENPHIYTYVTAKSIGVYNATDGQATVHVPQDGVYRDLLTEDCFTAMSGELVLPPRNLRAYLLRREI